LLLPEKDDPDTFVRSQGADAFRALAAGAIALPDFFVDELDKRVDFKSTGGRGRFDVSAKPLLRRLPEGSYRERFWTRCAARWTLADVFQKLMDDAPAFVVEQPRPPKPAPASARLSCKRSSTWPCITQAPPCARRTPNSSRH
jgi:DNA primase